MNPSKPIPSGPKLGLVVVGRNEGERLARCLASVRSIANRVYVDSGSTDGSIALAKREGVAVVELAEPPPFTAARARMRVLLPDWPKCRTWNMYKWSTAIAKSNGVGSSPHVSVCLENRTWRPYMGEGASAIRNARYTTRCAMMNGIPLWASPLVVAEMRCFGLQLCVRSDSTTPQ